MNIQLSAFSLSASQLLFPHSAFPLPNSSILCPMLYALCPLRLQPAFVSLTAHTLYSGMPEIGSNAAFVRRLAAAIA